MPSARPLRTEKAPGKLALAAVRWASIRCACPAGEKSSVPPSVPLASVSRPLNPPGSEREIAARMGAAGVERGDGDDRRRIRAAAGSDPLLVNGPSREPPLAR